MLDFRPDRLGHMCYMTAEAELQLQATGIPLELCLTSNIKTQTFNGFLDHHFKAFHAAGHPVVLCTDDSGVFGTTLSQEYAIAMSTFGLSCDQMIALALQSAEHAFLTPAELATLRQQMQKHMQKRVKEIDRSDV